MILRSIEPDSVMEIMEYCRQLEAFQVSIGIPPADRLERFCIGLYQVEGAINWQRTNCEYESYASAAIHFIVVMESLGFYTELVVPLQEISSLPRLLIDWKAFSMHASRAIRNLFYARQAGATIRSKRYDKTVLAGDLAYLVSHCISAIPTELRKQAFYDATEILSKRV
jgi:hypothetical protein